MTNRIAFLAATLLAALSQAGCNGITCGAGTEQKIDPMTGNTICVSTAANGGEQCGANTMLMGGVCVGFDPSKACGPGTKFDPASKTCIGAGPTPCEPPPCPTPDAAHICVHGSVHFLKDGTCTAGTPLLVAAYDPLAFLGGSTTPITTVMTDATGSFVVPNVTPPGTNLIALAVTDASGMPTTYILSASGQNNLAGGQTYSLDLWAIEKTTVAAWDTQAGLSGGNTFEMEGAYLARFVDKNNMPVAGVELTLGPNVLPPTEAFYFKGATAGDMSTLDKTATMTDANTGAVIDLWGGHSLGPMYSGMGGGQTWPAVLGASIANVIFVQTFPAM
jgi:hypothetical protein